MSDFQTISTGLLALLPCLCVLPDAAVAQPIESGIASGIESAANTTQTIITTEGNTTQIEGGVQTNQNLFHHFESFSVDPGHTADFVTPESVGAVIGQVSGGAASYIDGTLQVSGSDADLYLINPAGVLFGPDAQLNLGGSFSATTADQIQFGDEWLTLPDSGPDSDASQNDNTQNYGNLQAAPTAYRFTSETPGPVVNQGNLTVSPQASIRLSGGTVVNTGTLSAPGGEVSLNAVPGESLVRLNAAGSLLSIEVEAASVVGSATGDDDGAAVAPLDLPALLTGGDSREAIALQLNNDGSVTLGSRDYTAVQPGTVVATGQINVSSDSSTSTGGEINLLGTVVDVVGAQLNANGESGGGLIRVGGDYQGKGSVPTADEVFFDAEASADALSEGDGGEIIVWSDGVTQFSGLLSAQGAGAGAGGLVETSGLMQLTIGDRTRVLTNAESGDLGTWLLDPSNLSVVATGGTGTISGGVNSATDSQLNVSTLVSALNSTNVTLQATDSISINTAVNASGSTGNLRLEAPLLTLSDKISLGPGNQLSGTADIVQLSPNGNLQNAVDAVSTGGEVQLGTATYQDGEVKISRDVSLIGQGTSNTILSGGSINRVLDITDGEVSVSGLTIQDGRANQGAGIRVQGNGSLSLSNSLLTSNNAFGVGGANGGGLALSGTGNTFITQTTFDNNQSDGAAGAISVADNHQLSITRTTLSNNQARGSGGAIAANLAGASGSLNILSSTISGNTAAIEGGGIAIFAGTSNNLENVTIANNQAGSRGGGISVSGGGLQLGSSIVAGNRSAIDSDIAGTINSIGRNIVQNRGSSTGYDAATDLADGTDPMINALADNGGETKTHAWRVGSPAHDAGIGIGIGQRGIGATGPRDIGAYERLPARNLTFTAGTGQPTLVNTAFTDAVEVSVSDRFGVLLDKERITFSTDGTAADVNFVTPALQLSDDNGIARISLSANTVAGTVALNASVGSTTNATDLYNVADTAQDLIITGLLPVDIIAGNSAGFDVSAIDQFGNVATNYTGTIRFDSTDPQAQLPEPTVLTGGTGRFSGEPRTAGPHTLSVFDLIDNSLSATQTGIVVVPGAPDKVTFGDSQSTLVNTNFSNPLTVRVSDQFDNLITGESILFSAPDNGASAIFATPSAVTNGSGEASTLVSANDVAGNYSAIATVGSLTQSITLTNTPEPTPVTPVDPTPPVDPGVVDPNPVIPGPIDPSAPTVTNENQFSDPTLQSSIDSLLSSVTTADGSDEKDGRSSLFDEQAFVQLEQSLTEEYARYWQRPLGQGSDLESVQQILQQAENDYDSRSAIVYAVFVPPGDDTNSRYSAALSQRLLNNEVSNKQDQLMLLLIPPEGNPVQQRVDVTRQQLQRQAQLLNIEISSFLDDAYQPLARQLYDWLLAPIEEDIQAAGINDLMYVMDEGLSTVPLPALMTGDTYAVERYGLSVLPSVGLLQTDFGEAPAPQSVLAAGAATFDELEALPAVPVELALVEASADSSQVLLNEAFSIENIAAAQASSPKTMMHVATHAFFSPGSLDSSYIQFWEAQLNLQNLGALDLQDLELLILSACATAIGSREAELGFAGLAAATGVEASIGSLWNVSDMGTMALMAEFYAQLKENPLRAVALQQAQRSLLQGDTRIENNHLITQSGGMPLPDGLATRPSIDFSHPFFWSGFTLVGNPWW